jgi:signal transduction histidine kinase
MMTQSLRLLLVEDVEDDALLLVRELRKGGYDSYHMRVETPQELKAALANGPWDAVFSDFNLPAFTGLDALRIVLESGLDLPFILVSGVMGEETAVEALQAGAHDYLMKGRYARLVPALERALRDAALRHERRLTAEELTRHREHLEELVQQRTEELAAANEELQAQTEELQVQTEELRSQSEELQAQRKTLQAEIAERKRAEQEVNKLNDELAARAAELEAANVELEAFNYTVSHDLRGHLTHINGYCSVLGELCADRLDEECRDYLAEMANGTLKMNSLIDTLLKFSLLSHADIKRKAVDLGEMAGNIIGGLRMTEPQRTATVTIAQGLKANGDPELLRVALENLLGNAWKYTARKEEARIEFGVTTIAGETVYFVRDNGEGLDMAHADKLFTPFQRLTGAEEFKGHGIGLATVHRIILRHNGWVWAEGKPGAGATFYFTLP